MKWCPYIRKKIGKIIHIYDPVFCCNYWVMICSDQKEFLDTIKRKENIKIEFDPNRDGHFTGLTHIKKAPIALIWSRDRKYHLIHECLHAVSWHLESRGIKHTSETEEIYCYAQQFLLKAILEK